MSCPEITIAGISAALYRTLEKQALAAGTTFNGCTAKMRGITFQWTYDSGTQTLHATVTEKPIYISCTAIQSHIGNLIAQAKLTQLASETQTDPTKEQQ